METTNQRRKTIETIVIGALLTAIVIILQTLGQIRIGPFAISLVLLPIVIGAATCGPKIGAWLGFVFSVVVLMTDASAFFAVSIPGTVITVILKGTACGLVAGIVYKLLEKTNVYVAALAAAVVCPIVNTGVFLLGCYVFFLDTITEWGAAAGFENVGAYVVFGLVGINFIIEFLTTVIFSPLISTVLNLVRKK